MAGGSGAEGRSLEETPTWALAAVCFVFIAVSIFVEHLIHLLGNWLKRHRKAALFEAVEKLKSVLMLFGVMSLILAVTQRSISKICIPSKVAYTMLPCRKVSSTKTTKALGFSHLWTAATAQNSLPMKDLFGGIHLEPERRLAEEGSSGSSDYCESQGKTSFISQDGINQLNNFLFVLAMMQIVYSVLTMALGRAKMRRWKSWEMETQTVEYQVANDPNRFRFTRETTFGRRHVNSCAKTTTLLWIKCFFRQFFHSVAKVDYLTLRHGFISTHMSTSKSFNFQQYIQRSLEDDFKAVVGISPHLWFIAIIFMLVDVHGWNVYLWVSFIPLLTVLVLGTKLEVIVASMGMKLHDQNSVVIGTPLVEPNDNLFWFGQPKFVSTLLHFILFVTAFELAFLIWVTAQFGFNSCYHEHTKIIIIRVVLAVTVQVMCSYITLPLYALVTQMGSNFKSAVLGEQTMKTIKKWQSEVKGKRKKQDLSQFSVQDLSSTTTTLHTSTSSFSHPSSHHRKRAPSVSEMTDHFSSETEIEVQYQNHPQVGHNEVERVVVLSTPHDIEITEVEGRQSITKLV